MVSNSRYLTTHPLEQIDRVLRKAPPSPVATTVISPHLANKSQSKILNPIFELLPELLILVLPVSAEFLIVKVTPSFKPT